MTSPQRHSLVIGGTGMLRGVVLHLARGGHVVSVVARDRGKLDALVQEADSLMGRVNPIACDYAKDAVLRHRLGIAIRDNGPLELVVTWIREGAPDALATVAELADAGAGEAAPGRCRFFRVLGSMAADPSRPRQGRAAALKGREGLAYREVILGFRIDGDESRWNTNEEISAGVIDAIVRDVPDSIVGVVRPWEMNPRLRAAKPT